MEFSYRITEAEYRQAWKLRCRTSRSKVVRTVLFWVFILVCLMLLWTIVQRHSQQPVDTPLPVEQVNTGQTAASLVTNVGPFVLICGIWVFIMFGLTPMRSRRSYQKDPSMQGQFTVNITPASISTQNAVGTSSQTGWNIYEYWREGKNVIVLVFLSGTYFILSQAGLSDPQRNELRGILSVALPKK